MMASGSANLATSHVSAIGDDRALVPVGIVHHLGARGLRPFAELAHLDRALGGLLPERRRQQLLHRRDEIVEPIADVANQRHLGEHHIAHAGMIDAHVDEFRPARHDRRGAAVLELVADIDDHVGTLGVVERVEAAAGEISDPERMRLGEVGIELAHLRHRHAEHLGQLHRLGRRLRLVDLVADDHERHPRLDQELRRALDLIRIGSHPHARIDQLLRDDLGADALVVVIGMPGNVGGAVGRRPCRLEAAANGLRDHVRSSRQPGVLGDRLDDLLLVGDLLEAVTSGTPGLVGAVGIDDERRLLLEGVEHLADGIRHADDRRLHHDSRLARRLDVARRHGGAGPLMRREDVFELRPVDERLVELRILAGRIAEHVFHAAGDELIGKGGAAWALERLHAGDGGRRRRGCSVPRARPPAGGGAGCAGRSPARSSPTSTALNTD